MGIINDNNDITVVIPVFNREKTIRRCLDSIIHQTYLPKEIICVDDCSLDNSKKIIKEVAGFCSQIIIKYYCLDKNSGANAARSYGIKKASSKWIMFIDSDDEWEIDKIEKQVVVIKANNNLENLVVHGNCTIVDHFSGKTYFWQLPLIEGEAKFVHKKLLCTPAPMFQGILTSKKALESVGFLDEKVPAYQEWDISLLLSQKCKFIHLPDSLFKYHVHSDSIFRSLSRDYEGYQYILDKWKNEIEIYCSPMERYNHFYVQIKKLVQIGDSETTKNYIRRFFSNQPQWICYLWENLILLGERGVRLADIFMRVKFHGISNLLVKAIKYANR